MSDIPKIELVDLAKGFDGKRVLNGVDLSVPAGESLVVIGASGTGKSVMLKCILGLVEPDRGAVRIDGEDVTRLSGAARHRVNRKLGMLFQGAALFDSLPIWENVAFEPINAEGMGRKQARQLALARLDQVGLDPSVADLHPAELSGGMRKRAALARAIATDPDILLFDEPTTGLDPVRAATIDALIMAVTRKAGATAITITHDLASARRIADRIAFLHDGRIVWTGPPKAMEGAENDDLRTFVGGTDPRWDGSIPE